MSISGSSMSISFLDMEAKSSLNPTADWYPVGCGVYLNLLSNEADNIPYPKTYLAATAYIA